MATDEAQSERDAADEEDLRDEGRRAFDEGRYKEAYGLFHASVLNSAIRWFREEGVSFVRPPDEATPTELIVGLAIAANAELRERGEHASEKLSVAAWLFSTAADLRIALDQPTPLKVDAVSDKIAELTLRGVMLGQIDMLMSAIRLGWLEKLAQHEVERGRKSAGAAATNAKKATVKEQALGEAIRIGGRNPRLSHEEIGHKVRESLGLSTSTKTLTDWVREWRRKGYLAPWKKT